MSRDDIRAAVLDVLAGVAPEADFAALDPRGDLRQELDLDSMDFLNVLIALHRRLAVEIPESESSRLASLDAAVDYLAARVADPAVPRRTP